MGPIPGELSRLTNEGTESFSLSHEDDSVPSFLLILVIGGADLSSSSARRPRLSACGKMEKRERERERERENDERE